MFVKKERTAPSEIPSPEQKLESTVRAPATASTYEARGLPEKERVPEPTTNNQQSAKPPQDPYRESIP